LTVCSAAQAVFARQQTHTTGNLPWHLLVSSPASLSGP
jgi:hypothetical protein